MRNNLLYKSSASLFVALSVFIVFSFFLSSCFLFGGDEAQSSSGSSASNTSSPNNSDIELLSPTNNSTGLDMSSGILNFEWKSNYNNAKYELLIATSNPPSNSISQNITATTYDYDYQNNLALNTKYYWQVKATLEDGSIKSSSVHSFTTDNGLSIQALPNADAVSKGTQSFSWKISNQVASADYNFYIYLSDTKDFSDLTNLKKEAVDLANSSVSIDLRSINNLALGTKYYWKLVAEQKTDISQTIESEVLDFTTENIERSVYLTSPANYAPETAVGAVAFSWDIDTTIITGTPTYKILLDENNPPTTERNPTPTNTSFNFTSTANDFGKTYYWKVIVTDMGTDYESTVFQFTVEPDLTISSSSPANGASDFAFGDIDFVWTLPPSFKRANANTTLYFDTVSPPVKKLDLSAESFKFTHSGHATFGDLSFGDTYYWKLETTHAGLTRTSTERSFTIESDLAISSPSPQNAATDIAISDIALAWTFPPSFVAAGATTDIYLYKDGQPEATVATNISGESYVYKGIIDFDTKYSWKLTSTKSGISTSTTPRTFTTEKGTSLASPTQNAINQAPIFLKFEWDLSKSVTDATHSLYLDTNANPTTLVDNNLVGKSFIYTPLLSSNTVYYWKIVSTKVINGTTVQSKSGPWSFTSASISQNTTLLSPTNAGSDIKIVNAGVQFSWNYPNPPSGTTSTVYLDTNTEPSTPIVANQTASTYTYNGDIRFGTTYNWRVVSNNGSTYSMSPVHSFTTELANVGISGFITSSNGGPGVSGSTVTLEKTDGSKTFATTTTAADGSFSLNSVRGEFAVVARKTARATSKTVTYMESGMPVLGLQQFPVNYTGRSLDPPVINVWDSSDVIFTNNLTVGQDGTNFNIQFEVQASNPLTPSSGRPSLLISVNTLNSSTATVGRLDSFSNSINKQSTTIDIATLAPGKSYIEFKVYDNNNNQTKKIIPVNNALPEREDPIIMNKPGLGSTTVVISASTYGKERGLYSVQADTTAYVEILAFHDDNNGLMIYRGTNAADMKYIASTSSKVSSDGDDYFYYIDTSPELVDGTIYVYKLKYYYKSNLDAEVITSELSDEFRVPILPRLTSSLQTPTKDQVLTNPTTIDFTWQIDSDLSFLVNDQSYTNSSLEREDTLKVKEDGSGNIMYAKSGADAIKKTGAAAGSGSVTSSWDLSLQPFPLINKHFYWYVTSEINYTKVVSANTATDPNYAITATSNPYGAGSEMLNKTSQDGVNYFSIK